MPAHRYPSLDQDTIKNTRAALHAYSGVLGDCLKLFRPKRKHWWHASLRPSLTGLTTGVIHADVDFEIELDFSESHLRIRTATGESYNEPLKGQAVRELVGDVSEFLTSTGVDRSLIEKIRPGSDDRRQFDGFSAEQANLIGRVFSNVAAAMSRFRAEIREESSPVQIWPHHFDMSMLWLPGEKIPDQDPDDEESADKQLNFGFVFGDESIPEPYFYVTTYPLAEAFAAVKLPVGTTWQSTPFPGAVLRYEKLPDVDEPEEYLLGLWRIMLRAGRTHLLDRDV